MNFFTDVIQIVTEHYPFLLRGIGYTMLIALIGTVAGLVIGLATGVLRTCPMSKNGFVRIMQKVLNGLIDSIVSTTGKILLADVFTGIILLALTEHKISRAVKFKIIHEISP